MAVQKRMLPVIFTLLLLLVTLASPAAACINQGNGGADGQRLPLKIYLEEDCQRGDSQPIICRFTVPSKNGETKKYCSSNSFTANKQYHLHGWSAKFKTAPGYKPMLKPLPRPIPGPLPEPVPEPGEEPAEEPAEEPGEEPGEEPSEEPGQDSVLTAEEEEMWQSVNEERRRAGLEPLQIHEGLVGLARLKSADMIELGYFAHQSPTYGSPFEMIAGAGITYLLAGENIAGAPTVARAHQSLMNSPGHRANILQANFTHVGIGIVDGGPYGKMFTQIFIGQR